VAELEVATGGTVDRPLAVVNQGVLTAAKQDEVVDLGCT
jgi:hypothetical protein